MSELSKFVHKIHNHGVAARFDELRKSNGDDAAIEYAARMLGPKRNEYEPKMKMLAAKDKAPRASAKPSKSSRRSKR